MLRILISIIKVLDNLNKITFAKSVLLVIVAFLMSSKFLFTDFYCWFDLRITETFCGREHKRILSG